MSGRSWGTFRLGGGFHLIVSKTGPRIAYRGKHGQISTRSAYAKVGPFHWFAPRSKRKARR